MKKWERYLTDLKDRDWVICFTAIIEEAFDNLIDTECPHCHNLTQVPTFEEIQEWLEKEENER